MLVLASQSPRRQALLAQMGLEFIAKSADIDEKMDPQAPLAEEIVRVSLRKAEAVRALCSEDDVIVAADTLVCVEQHRLGKPHSAEQACRMLQLLSGKTHSVLTGFCVMRGERTVTECVTTHIRFRTLTQAEIERYVASGDPMDKAGAYAIQGQSAVFIEGIEGDYYNVMGLPLCALTKVLRRFGIPVLGCTDEAEGSGALTEQSIQEAGC